MKKEKVLLDFEQFMQELFFRTYKRPIVKYGDSFIENLQIWTQSKHEGLNKIKWLAESINKWGHDYQNKYGSFDEDTVSHLREYFYPILHRQIMD